MLSLFEVPRLEYMLSNNTPAYHAGAKLASNQRRQGRLIRCKNSPLKPSTKGKQRLENTYIPKKALAYVRDQSTQYELWEFVICAWAEEIIYVPAKNTRGLENQKQGKRAHRPADAETAARVKQLAGSRAAMGLVGAITKGASDIGLRKT